MKISRFVMAVLVMVLTMSFTMSAMAEERFNNGKMDRNGLLGEDGRSWRQGWSNILVGEGATSDAYETYIYFTDPTADNVILFPNSSGTVQLSNNPGFTGTPVDGDLNIYNAGDGLFRAQEMWNDVGLANNGNATIQAEAVETSMILNCPDGQMFMSTDASSGSVACVALSLTGDVTSTIINAGTGAATVVFINNTQLGDTTAGVGNILVGSSTFWQSVAPSGDITVGGDGAFTIGANKIGTGEFNYEEITVFIVNGFVFGNAPATAGSIITGYRPIANIAMAKMANSVIMNGSSVQIFIGAVNWNTYQEWGVTVVKP